MSFLAERHDQTRNNSNSKHTEGSEDTYLRGEPP